MGSEDPPDFHFPQHLAHLGTAQPLNSHAMKGGRSQLDCGHGCHSTMQPSPPWLSQCLHWHGPQRHFIIKRESNKNKGIHFFDSSKCLLWKIQQLWSYVNVCIHYRALLLTNGKELHCSRALKYSYCKLKCASVQNSHRFSNSTKNVNYRMNIFEIITFWIY